MKLSDILSGPGYERLKAERESGYTGWLDKDGHRVTDDGRTMMDPNETLRLAREASNRIGNGDPTAAVDLMMYFDALDQWLSNGGFAPKDWIEKTHGSTA